MRHVAVGLGESTVRGVSLCGMLGESTVIRRGVRRVAAGLGEDLERYVAKTWPDGVVRIVRTAERAGLIRARIAGAKAATGDVLVILDSHCEVNEQWYVSSTPHPHSHTPTPPLSHTPTPPLTLNYHHTII